MASTIKEIAARLNVSVATVSRALNDLPGVGEKTRRRVRKAAAELGYVPDFHARALVSGKVPFLALVVPDITNSFFPALALAAEEEASAAGFSLLLFNTNSQPDRMRQALDLLASRRVSGLILAEPIGSSLSGSIEILPFERSMVFAGVEAPAGSAACSVLVDDFDGGRQVGLHLIEQGVHTVAFVGGPENNRNSSLRLAGLRSVNAGSNGRPALDIVATTAGSWTEQSGYEQAAQVFKSGVPDAVFAANDLLALGVMRFVGGLGILPGRGMALCGYDDTPIVSRVFPALTSVAQPEAEIGVESVRRLLSCLAGHERRESLTLKAVIRPRSSTLEFKSNIINGGFAANGG